MSHIHEIDGLPFDPSRLPSELQGLVPLLAEWAVSDDLERNRKISSASRDALEDLHREVSPQLSAIDRFCDDQEAEDDAYEAPLLGRLAEAAIEAEHELTRRDQAPSAASRTCPHCNGNGFHQRPHPTVEDGWIPELCLHCAGSGRVAL